MKITSTKQKIREIVIFYHDKECDMGIHDDCWEIEEAVDQLYSLYQEGQKGKYFVSKDSEEYSCESDWHLFFMGKGKCKWCGKTEAELLSTLKKGGE